MDFSKIQQLLLKNFPQKMVALVAAIVIWFLVNQGITIPKTISNIPVRIVNLPHGLTVPQLLPNGIYPKRINLTLTGTQDVLQGLETGDFEVQLDATGRPPGEWPVIIAKNDLKSLDGRVDLSEHIVDISQSEMVLSVTRLITMQVPVMVVPKKESAPRGFQYLDIWPSHLLQTLVGPEEEVEKLAASGIELEIDLSKITREQLEIASMSNNPGLEDEISYYIPVEGKLLFLPQISPLSIALNDSEAKDLRVNFLKESLIPLNINLPIMIFYPMESSGQINPLNTPLEIEGVISQKDGIAYLNKPLYIGGASRRFVDIVQSHMSITINARPRPGTDRLQWNAQVVNPRALEDLYVSLMMGEDALKNKGFDRQREAFVRDRFREYLHTLRLFVGKDRKLHLDCRLDNDRIRIFADTIAPQLQAHTR